MPLITETQILNVLGTQATQPESLGRLQMVLPAVISLAESFTDRALNYATFQDFYTGNGAATITFRRQPCTAVTYVSINDCVLTANTKNANGAYPTTYMGYGFTESKIILFGGLSFTVADFPNVFIKYTAGYTTLPADLLNALVQEGAWQITEMARLGKSASRFSDAGTEMYDVVDLSPRCKLTLNKYRLFNNLN